VRRVYDPAASAFAETPVYDGERLGPGDVIAGPAVVEYAGTTVALPSGQVGSVDELLGIWIRRAA
jgi:N-methylhydantoinase A